MRTLLLITLLVATGCRSGGEGGGPAPHDDSAALPETPPPAPTPPADEDELPRALQPPPAGEGEPANPLQHEMRLLTAATQVAVVAVANDQLQLIPPALQQVHGAIEDTQAALRAGEIELPRKPDDVEGFLAQDDAFHDELVKLLQASRANDLPEASRQLGVILEGCTDCHQKYRFPGTAAQE